MLNFGPVSVPIWFGILGACISLCERKTVNAEPFAAAIAALVPMFACMTPRFPVASTVKPIAWGALAICGMWFYAVSTHRRAASHAIREAE